jgi:membrane-associated phospholipid phosphatase
LGCAIVQLLILILCAVGLAVIAVAAHFVPYFPGDVAISHAVQAYHADWVDALTSAASWVGFPPQVDVIFGVIVLMLAVFGLRWEAVMLALAGIGSGATYFLLQLLVDRPRPSPDLVRVAGSLPMSGFPSGHLATLTAVFGFLAYISYRRLSPSPVRWVTVALVVAFLALLSFARIYSGQHWPSDVLAGVLLGALWQQVAMRIYLWGEARRRPGVMARPLRTLGRGRGAARARVHSV